MIKFIYLEKRNKQMKIIQHHSLIYHKNTVLNMKLCISIQMFPDDKSIVLTFTNGKDYVFRDVEELEESCRILAQAMEY